MSSPQDVEAGECGVCDGHRHAGRDEYGRSTGGGPWWHGYKYGLRHGRPRLNPAGEGRSKVTDVIILMTLFRRSNPKPNSVQGESFRLSKVRILCCCFEHCASFVTLYCSSSLSCMNEYLDIDSGGYLYEQPLCSSCSVAGCFPEKLRWCLIEQGTKM